MELEDAEVYLRNITRRASTRDALKWLQEGRTLVGAAGTSKLLAALVAISGHRDQQFADLGMQALRTACRSLLRSDLDPASELLDIEAVVRPEAYREGLDVLAALTPSGTLRDLTPAAVAAGQAKDSMVIPTLCAVAGITFKELRGRARLKLPSSSDGPWSVRQVAESFKVIDEIVEGIVEARSPVAVALRPVEMIFADGEGRGGWDLVERMRTVGAPYEVLLTQRVVGSSWGAHRNSTSTKVQKQVTDELCRLFDAEAVSYRRVDRDKASRGLLAELATSRGEAPLDGDDDERSSASGQVTVLADTGGTTYAIAVSVATDGGTANKSGAKLAQLQAKFSVPVAVVLVGPGWAKRGESMDLVRAFDGRTYTELTLAQLVRDILPMVIQPTEVS